RENIHAFVVIPGIAALLAGGAKLEFAPLLFHCLRIKVRRGENGFLAASSKKAAGGLSDAGRDSTNIACFEIQKIDLVKRISRFALTLKDEQLAIVREIAFPASLALVDQLARIRDELSLLPSRIGAEYSHQ